MNNFKKNSLMRSPRQLARRARGTSCFNDMLGTTLGAKTKHGKYSAAALTAFGGDLTIHSPTPTSRSNFFTGKPHVAGLGYAFLFRNYRAGLAKWQTSDPLGYPDGWNQLAYCANDLVSHLDILGCLKTKTVDVSIDQSFLDPNGMGFDGTGIIIPWYNSSYDGLLTLQAIADELRKKGMTLNEYITDWIKTSAREELNSRMRSAVSNVLIEYLLRVFNNGYYGVDSLQDELESRIKALETDGWRVTTIVYKGATVDSSDSVQAGAAALILTGCTHLWAITLVKE